MGYTVQSKQKVGIHRNFPWYKSVKNCTRAVFDIVQKTIVHAKSCPVVLSKLNQMLL
jgi:hypothetical protein